MYTPRLPSVAPAMRSSPEPETRSLHLMPEKPARKPARRLTRNPVLAGIVNNAMRLWK